MSSGELENGHLNLDYVKVVEGSKQVVYRTYVFCHSMLSATAVGVQAQHATVDMFTRYMNKPNTKRRQKAVLGNLSKPKNKTTIFLDGGKSKGLHEVSDFLFSSELPYPFGLFREDQDSLEGTLTSVIVVVPDKIWDCPYPYQKDGVSFTEEFVEHNIKHKLTDTAIELAIMIRTAKLCRG